MPHATFTCFGPLVAECRVDVGAVTAEREQQAQVAITDAAGDVVARATSTWRLRPPVRMIDPSAASPDRPTAAVAS